jgi:protein-tyrosine phosphatase
MDPTPIEIIEGLFLGSVGASMNKDALDELGITNILTVADKLPPLYPQLYNYKVIEILDNEESNLKVRLPEAIEFIHSVLSRG